MYKTFIYEKQLYEEIINISRYSRKVSYFLSDFNKNKKFKFY